MLYEVCVGSYKEAVEKERLGAHRVELCCNLLEGGTTPSYGTIKATVSELNIPVMVMIRPRGGDFNYSSSEIEIMKEDIKVCKELGVYGVVVGVLKNDAIDTDTLKILADLAKPMSITFHMAFDEVKDMFTALDTLIDIGIDRVLTKGGDKSAIDGKEVIKDLVEYADNRIVIMPGKGITKENREQILQYTGAIEIHGSKIV